MQSQYIPEVQQAGRDLVRVDGRTTESRGLVPSKHEHTTHSRSRQSVPAPIRTTPTLPRQDCTT